MVAYSCKAQFEGPIRAGIKPHTMRNDRKRHARPGEEIQLYTAMRTKHCRLIGRATCKAVTPVMIDFRRAIVRIGGMAPIKSMPRLDQFAIRDGFGCWAELHAFWKKEHKAKKQPDGTPAPPLSRWSGVLIEWKDFRPA